MADASARPQSTLRTALAGLIGNVLEWFDFAVYGYFASNIGHQFFPTGDPAVQQLSAYATFALGFFARPIGGIDCAAPPDVDPPFPSREGPFADGGFLADGDIVVQDAPLLPTSKEQCGHGGWRGFPGLRNQGQCVAFVVRGQKN